MDVVAKQFVEALIHEGLSKYFLQNLNKALSEKTRYSKHFSVNKELLFLAELATQELLRF